MAPAEVNCTIPGIVALPVLLPLFRIEPPQAETVALVAGLNAEGSVELDVKDLGVPDPTVALKAGIKIVTQSPTLCTETVTDALVPGVVPLSVKVVAWVAVS